MTRVDFYFNVSNQLSFACRLIRKVYYDSTINCWEPMLVFCSDKNKLNDFNELLYSFSSLDFLPHIEIGDQLEGKTPIILSQNPWIPVLPRRAKLLLNLDNKICQSFCSFDRVVELVGNMETEKLPAREKFVFYKNRGFEIHNHDIHGKA